MRHYLCFLFLFFFTVMRTVKSTNFKKYTFWLVKLSILLWPIRAIESSAKPNDKDIAPLAADSVSNFYLCASPCRAEHCSNIHHSSDTRSRISKLIIAVSDSCRFVSCLQDSALRQSDSNSLCRRCTSFGCDDGTGNKLLSLVIFRL